MRCEAAGNTCVQQDETHDVSGVVFEELNTPVVPHRIECGWAEHSRAQALPLERY